MIDLGIVKPGSTIRIPFSTFDSNDPQGSSAITNFAVGDIQIHKDGGTTQRASTSGFTATTSFDTYVGINFAGIDLADNTTAGFYASGSEYLVTIADVTLDAATVRKTIGRFVIGYPDALINTTIATLASQTSFTLTDGPAEDDALNGCPVIIHDVASAVQLGKARIQDYTGSSKTVTLAAATSFTAAATDNISIMMPDAISATAVENFEDMYDTTGYTDDSAPASRSQLDQLTVTGAALNVAASSFTLTTGSQVNTYTNTVALDGNLHELTDAAGTLDGYYVFNIGGDGAPTSVTIKAEVTGNGDDFSIEVNTGSSGTPSWQVRGTIEGYNATQINSYTIDLFQGDVLSDDASAVWVRINGTGLTSASFDVDQIFTSKSVVTRSVGYDGGQVWIDTADGTAGTESYVNGVADNAVLTLADAKTIASNVGLHKYNVSNESTITLAGSTVNEEYTGVGWTLALGGQDISNSHFYGANAVSGTSTSPTGETHFVECEFNNATVGNSHTKNCGFDGTFTAAAAASYYIVEGYSQVAGSGSPTFTYTGLGSATTINVREWHGGGTWNFDANCTASIEVSKGGTHTIAVGGGDVEFRGFCKAVSLTGVAATSTVNVHAFTGAITVNGTGGTVNVYGQHSGITDSSGGSVTINDFSVDGPAVGTNIGTIITTLGTPTDTDNATDIANLQTVADAIQALLDNARAEPGQGAPAVNPDAMTKIDYLYKAWRNKSTQTSTTYSLYDDAGTTVDQKSTDSDDGTTATKGEIVTGP